MSTVHLNRKLVLEAPARTPDGAGGFVESWTELGALWAQVRAGTGRESEQATATLSRVPYKITVRGAPVGSASRPNADQRFREGARLFRILAVADPDPTGRYLICNAVEEVVA